MISFLGSEATAVTNDSLSQNITIPSGTNYVILFASFNNNVTLPDITVNSVTTIKLSTYVPGITADSVGIYGVANSTTGSVNLSCTKTGYQFRIIVMYFSGVMTTSNVGQTTNDNQLTGIMSLTLTPNNSNSVLIAGFSSLNHNGDYVTVTGATKVSSINLPLHVGAYEVLTSGGSKTVQGSWGQNIGTTGIMAEIYAQPTSTANAIFFGTNM